MAIKYTYDNLESIPENMVDLYAKQEDGTYSLGEVEGLVQKTKVDEFRDNNINLRKQIEEIQSGKDESVRQAEEIRLEMEAIKRQYDGIDLEEVKALQAERKAMEEKKLIEAGEVDKLIEQRVQEVLGVKDKEAEGLKSGYEAKMKELTELALGYDAQLNEMLVDNEITRLAAEAGVRSTAVDDVLNRGRSMFEVEDGVATAKDSDGRKIYGDDAVTPLTIEGWLTKLTDSAPHLFESSKGSGSKQQHQETPGQGQDLGGTDAILAGLASLR